MEKNCSKSSSQEAPLKGILKKTKNDSEKAKALKEVRYLVKRRINKGARPLKEIENFIRKWMKQCHEVHRIVVINTEKEESDHEVKSTIIPSYAFHDTNRYKVDAVKWRTKKAKYKGPQLQSPIDIEPALVRNCKYYRRLKIIGLWDNKKQTRLSNTGVTIKGTLSGEAYISDGPLFGKYRFENFHFHYGNKKYNGTEHSINGRRFALEIHIVFGPVSCEGYPPRVVGAQCAKTILALLFQESEEPSNYELFDLIEHVNTSGKKLFVLNNLLHDFKDVLSSNDYYNYIGCCTTEPFLPNVEWIIFKQILHIHKTQIEYLWDLRKASGIKGNVRARQPKGERTIYQSTYKDHIKCRGAPVCEC